MTAATIAGASTQGQATQATATANRDPGLTLCLSGGGFRATLFHLGALRRLNELGVLSRAQVITSVSGGSILNGVLATRWGNLHRDQDGTFTNFDTLVGEVVRAFCARDLRTRLLVGTRLDLRNLPVLIRNLGSVPANFLAEAYEQLFQRRRLADLPEPGSGIPRFIFCATSVQTGACWHFHSGVGARMGDFYTDYCPVGDVKINDAVAASSAFPPGFGALLLCLPPDVTWSRIDPWGEHRPLSGKRRRLPGSSNHRILLTDGGVYDNLGVEPIWTRSRTLLVSDAGRPFESVPSIHQALVPRLRRAFEISAEQVGAVRKRWLIDCFQLAEQIGQLRATDPRPQDHDKLWESLPARVGALWAINTRLEDFHLDSAQGYSQEVRDLFPIVRTDLNAFSAGEIACLENHGYSLADAAMRKYAPALCPNVRADFRWPHPDLCSDSAVERALAGSAKRHLLRDLLCALRFV
jgi:NTE family protein